MKIFILLFLLTSCVTREQVEATLFLNNFNDKDNSLAELCERVPELKQRGFYRRLNDGKLETVSICNPIARDFLAIHKDDLNRLLDKALPKPRQKKD
jgi:wobble nucleotide-excising tRNase